MTGVLAIVVLVLLIVSAIKFNSLRVNWYGIIGLPSAYLFFCFFVGGLSTIITQGQPVMGVIFMVIGLIFLVWIEIKCKTVAQHILAPFVAILLVCGFVVRIILSVVFHMEMANPGEKSTEDPELARMSFTDFTTSKGTYKLQSTQGDYAWYKDPDGREVKLSKEDVRKM